MTPSIVIAGDLRFVLPHLCEAWADAIVTDPPYELGFMGKRWDASGVAFDPDTWRLALRAAKPGAHLAAFGGTRTFHRMTCAIEDAGWEIRDCLSWLYGQGFPKSLNGAWGGTALKPAWEPIVLARKPLAGTVGATFAAHGTGGLGIDATRIEYANPEDFAKLAAGVAAIKARGGVMENSWKNSSDLSGANDASAIGRWPANVCLDEEAAEALDAQSGEVGGGPGATGRVHSHGPNTGLVSFQGGGGGGGSRVLPGGTGGASRFFYVAKASTAERERGCEALPKRSAGDLTGGRAEGSAGLHSPRAGAGRTSGGRANHHPTVKPIALMRWLVRLVTPPGSNVLDPFCGSGSTGCAATLEGRAFFGIDLDPEYVEIARARIAAAI